MSYIGPKINEINKPNIKTIYNLDLEFVKIGYLSTSYLGTIPSSFLDGIGQFPTTYS